MILPLRRIFPQMCFQHSVSCVLFTIAKTLVNEPHKHNRKSDVTPHMIKEVKHHRFPQLCHPPTFQRQVLQDVWLLFATPHLSKSWRNGWHPLAPTATNHWRCIAAHVSASVGVDATLGVVMIDWSSHGSNVSLNNL